MSTPTALPPEVHWLSESPRPKRVLVVDDTLSADDAFRIASAGTAMLWQGDFQNARQLLQALARRLDKRCGKPPNRTPPNPQVGAGNTAIAPSEPPDQVSSDTFHRYRMGQAQKARTLGLLLLPIEAGYVIPLRRAPDVTEACTQALGPFAEAHGALPLRELQGVIGAYEWRRKGVMIEALGTHVHPHYGVFAPVRSEYLDLVVNARLPEPCHTAFDLGTGTGVLAALLAKRGVECIIATDSSARALTCAQENIVRLHLAKRVTLAGPELFPSAAVSADLIVCNPPWLPGKAGSLLEQAVYDPESRMLRGFLSGAAERLSAHGEAWLILSDLAELLGLRSRDQLLTWIEAGHLTVRERLDTRPSHKRSHDVDDPLHAARQQETTSLWRLVRR
ncbi:MAG: class I SAM-dependent methyltransferase [Rhodocyclaceae bacterium]|nr:class I SAM-dependent methyltransferase [Rhodocyclaceae bacterium]